MSKGMVHPVKRSDQPAHRAPNLDHSFRLPPVEKTTVAINMQHLIIVLSGLFWFFNR
jgi:hypothetical protein